MSFLQPPYIFIFGFQSARPFQRISKGIALTLIPNYMRSCHGQISIEKETDSLLLAKLDSQKKNVEIMWTCHIH